MTTTIKISDWAWENLKALKVHPNQSYSEVIEELIKKEVEKNGDSGNK